MPAPATYEYSVAALVEAQTALRDRIDAGTAAGKLKLYTEADVLLVTLTLSDPSGTINGTTGQLTITAVGSTPAVADGTCTYGTVTDSDDVVVLTAPAQAGGSAVSGAIVISTTSIVTGADVALISFTVG